MHCLKERKIRTSSPSDFGTANLNVQDDIRIVSLVSRFHCLSLKDVLFDRLTNISPADKWFFCCVMLVMSSVLKIVGAIFRRTLRLFPPHDLLIYA